MKKELSIMKRMGYIAAALMAAVIFSGCSTTAQAETSAASAIPEAQNRLEAIRERGYMEVVMEPYLAPFEFIDPSKKGDEMYVGADVELAKYIAEELGVECRIIPLDFATVLSSITEGKYDMAISGLAYTPARAEAMEMSSWSKDAGASHLPQNGSTGDFPVNALLPTSLSTSRGSVYSFMPYVFTYVLTMGTSSR